MIDLQILPAPQVVEELSFEAILAQAKADFAQRMRPHLPVIDSILELESEPIVKLLETHAYRELLYRQRVNDAARAHLLAFATGADLDQKGAFYGVARLPGPPLESDTGYRKRIQLRVAALAGSGTAQAYEYTALTASLNVHDAIAVQPFPGRVQVLLWLHDVTLADATQATVLAALNANAARPLGVAVSVALARPRAIDITAALTREAGAPVNLLAQLQAALPAAMASYARLGRAVSRSWITTRLHVTGIAAVRYPTANAPAELTAMAADEYPVLGAVHLIDEGLV